MKIIKARIQNFRSIWELQLPSKHEKEFGNLVVFIGRNNSGKSNIINALRLVLTHLDGKLVKEFPFHQYIWFFGYHEKPAQIELTIKLDEQEIKKIIDEIKAEAGIEDIKWIKLRVELSRGKEKVAWKLSEMKLFGHVSSKAMEITDEAVKIAKEVAGGTISTKEKEVSSGIDVVRDGKIVNSKIFEALITIIGYASGKIRYIYPAQATQIDQVWSGRNEPGIPSDLLEDIKKITSGYHKHRFMEYLGEVKAESSYIGGETEPIKYYEGEKLPLWLFGNGDQSFDGIVAAIQLHARQHKGGILFLETPEMNLHPEFVRELAVFIEETAEEETIQLFVVTQSPEFIDALIDRENIIIVRQEVVRGTPLGTKPATQVVSFKAENSQLIESLIAELGSSRILFSNVVLLVEGGDDVCLLRYWINSNRNRLRHLRRYSTDILPCSRRIDIKAVAKTLKMLGVKFFVFLDGDKRGKDDYNMLVKEKLGEYTYQWTVADVLGFIEGEKLVQAIGNVMKRLGIKEDKLKSKLKEEAYKKYQDCLEKINGGSLRKQEGKDAFEDLLSIIFENFEEIKARYYDKWIFRDRFKHMLGSELMRFKLETPEEVISVLAKIDQMLKPSR
ncbi:MAG: ATP-dependent nuclease [Candidatus Baldrarchaeia archaeon]